MFSKLFRRNKSDKDLNEGSSTTNEISNSGSNNQYSTSSLDKINENNMERMDVDENENQEQNENERDDKISQKLDIKQMEKNSQKKLPNKRHSHTGALNIPGYQMTAGSNITNERIQQLMEWKGGPKDTGERSKSMNINDPSIDSDNSKRKKPDNREENRRYSMFPKDKELIKEQDFYATTKKNRKDDNIITTQRSKRVPYRVKNEVFVLYDHYQPVKILGSGAYAVVCEAIDTRTGRKVAIKKKIKEYLIILRMLAEFCEKLNS